MLILEQIEQVSREYNNGLITSNEYRNRLVLILVDDKCDGTSLSLVSIALAEHLR